LRSHLFAVECVGQLNQDAGAIAHQLVRADRTPVVQVFQNLERVAHDTVAFLAPDVGDKAHTTGIMLLLPCIQTKLLQMRNLGRRGHSPLLEN
jgi:hypothetical protein